MNYGILIYYKNCFEQIYYYFSKCSVNCGFMLIFYILYMLRATQPNYFLQSPTFLNFNVLDRTRANLLLGDPPSRGLL